MTNSVRYTEEEYLALEQDSEIKHEYVAGEIFAMSGAGRKHNLIALNVSSDLHSQLANRPCEVYQSDMRVQVKATGAYRYPDIVVVCGEPDFSASQPESLLNPTLLIEILSESTASVDRGEKLAEYRRIPSLQEYLLISQDVPRIERYLNQDEHNWLYTELTGLDQQIALPSIDCTLLFSDVFHRIDFTSAEPPTDTA